MDGIRLHQKGLLKLLASSVCGRENDVLIDEDVELVTRSNLYRRLDIEVLRDGLLGDAAERLGEISARRVGGGVLCRKR